jgi:hypothetical protein
MSGKSKTDSRRSTLLIISVILVVVLVSSLCAYKFLVVNDGLVRVKNATDLREAVNKAEVGIPVNIMLTKDISLGSELTIPAGADITLTSTAKENSFFRLIGLDGQNVITVENGGRLTLNGIIVTHEVGSTGNGIVVGIGGTLIMIDGEIFSNIAAIGGGVHNYGFFEMSGGTISGNTAAYGGGVCNKGVFKMAGGKISNNQATDNDWGAFGGGNGGGVWVAALGASFNMLGGEISGNTATKGGGVYIEGNLNTFEKTGGEISSNTANDGSNVYNET